MYSEDEGTASPIINMKELFYKSFNNQEDIKITTNKIVIGGMGGSAISGEYLKSLAYRFDSKLIFHICRNYNLPEFIDKSWLIVIISYSGNTEESVSLLQDAYSKKLDIIGISSGGKIKEFCEKNNIVHFLIDGGYQPRFAFPMIYGKLVKIFFKNMMHDEMSLMDLDTPEITELISGLLGDTIPVIITTESEHHLGLRFRCQLNENSKKVGSNFTLPEFNHNGIVSLDTKANLSFHYIFILNKNLHSSILKQAQFLQLYLKKKGHNSTEFYLSGNNLIEESLSITRVLDYVSYRVAIIEKTNPIEVKAIDELKKYLSENTK